MGPHPHGKVEVIALQAEERARTSQLAAAEALTAAEASAAAAKAAEVKAAEVQRELEPRRQLACTVAVQLSDALSRSGSVSREAPMLCDSSSSSWDWERLALTLSGLASHVCCASMTVELGSVTPPC